MASEIQQWLKQEIEFAQYNREMGSGKVVRKARIFCSVEIRQPLVKYHIQVLQISCGS